MLIRFTVSNFRSFNEEVVFSMLPGAAQKHTEHIISDHPSEIDVLRFAMLYGANASGKSNLVSAIDFARKLIVDGIRPKQTIAVEPFRLDRAMQKKPSRFEFEFMVERQAYAYGFVVDRRTVHEEWLYAVNTKTEHALFERKTVNRTEIEATFAKSLEADQQFLEFVARGTRANELLLTKLVENDLEQFSDIYTWFQHKLTIVFPQSRHKGLEINVYKDQKFSEALGSFLKSMNTGIDEVCTRAVDLETIDFPIDLILERWEEEEEPEDIKEATEKLAVINTPERQYLLHHNEQDELEAHILSTRRKRGEESIEFELSEESDGTKRLFDLFPILHSAEDRVFIIDELERSLHPNLVRNFIEQFLGKKHRNQLVVTTHESTLLDLSIFRRDEIWFIEKTPEGASQLYSLEEFKPRHDLDIRKGYLQGRFGAIPVFGSYLQGTPVGE